MHRFLITINRIINGYWDQQEGINASLEIKFYDGNQINEKINIIFFLIILWNYFLH